jgi:hypothetical protein
MGKRTIRSLLAELDLHLEGLREEVKAKAKNPGCENCIAILRQLADKIDEGMGPD